MSSIGWVDFSSTDREKVSQVLAMLQEPGTLDELGIGQIRDAFADLLFPGFSTIQTRAKYFITVPRIIRDYMELDARIQRRTSLRDYLESRENEVARLLVERHVQLRAVLSVRKWSGANREWPESRHRSIGTAFASSGL